MADTQYCCWQNWTVRKLQILEIQPWKQSALGHKESHLYQAGIEPTSARWQTAWMRHNLLDKLSLYFCRYKVKLSSCIIKHSVKMWVGIEVWLHEVLNLGTTRGSNIECEVDWFVMQHSAVFITAQKPTMWNTVLYGGMAQPADPTALHDTTDTTALHSTSPWTQRTVPCQAVGHVSHLQPQVPSPSAHSQHISPQKYTNIIQPDNLHLTPLEPLWVKAGDIHRNWNLPKVGFTCFTSTYCSSYGLTIVTENNVPPHLGVTLVLQHSLMYENPHDPDKQHCSTCISRPEHKQRTKVAAGQFILHHLLIIFNENWYFNIYYNAWVTEATLCGY
jgi:hypothetical protein